MTRPTLHPNARAITVVIALAGAAVPGTARAQQYGHDDIFVELQTPAQKEIFSGWCASPATQAAGKAAQAEQLTDTAGPGTNVAVFFGLDMRETCVGKLVQALAKHEPVTGTITLWHPSSHAPDSALVYTISSGNIARVSVASAESGQGAPTMHVEVVSPSWSAAFVQEAGTSGSTGPVGGYNVESSTAPTGSASPGNAQSGHASGSIRTSVLRSAHPMLAPRRLTLAQLPRIVKSQSTYNPAQGDLRHPEWVPASLTVPGVVVTLVGTSTTFPSELSGMTFLGMNLGFDARLPVSADGRTTGPLSLTITPLRKWTGAATSSLQTAAGHHEALRSATVMLVRRGGAANPKLGPEILLTLQHPVLASDALTTQSGSTRPLETVTLTATGATVWEEYSDYTGSTAP